MAKINKSISLFILISVLLVLFSGLVTALNYDIFQGHSKTREIELYNNLDAENVSVTFNVVDWNDDFLANHITFDPDSTISDVNYTLIKTNMTIDVPSDAEDIEFNATLLINVTNTTGHSINITEMNLVINVLENTRPELVQLENWSNILLGEEVEQTLIIANNELDNIVYSLENAPSGMSIEKVNDTHATITWEPTTVTDRTVSIRVNETNMNRITTFEFDASSIQEGIHLDIPTFELGGINQEREFISQTFTLRNTGSRTISGINIEALPSQARLDYNISQISTTSLEPNEELTFFVEMNIPSDQDSGRQSIGNIRISYTPEGDSQKIETKSVHLTTKSNIEIYRDVEYSVNRERRRTLSEGSFFRTTVGDSVRIFVVAENIGDEEMYDVEFILESEDYDLLEGRELEQVHTRTVRSGSRTNTMEFEFEIPYRDIREGTYDLTLFVTAEDYNRAIHRQEFSFRIDVDRPRYEILIEDYRLSPTEVTAGRMVSLDLRLLNIGRNDEDEVYFNIVAEELGIDERYGPFELFTDESFSRTLNFQIPEDVSAGEYVIKVETFYDRHRSSDTEYIFLNVRSPAVIDPEPEPKPEEDFEIITEPSTPIEDPVYGRPVEADSLFGDDFILVLLLILVIVMVGVIIIILIPGKTKK